MATQDRSEQEKTELKHLAAYAQSSAESRGRYHDEEPNPRRTGFQRDRDRIVHSRAFRRLEFKTQLFLDPEGKRSRSRLTHVIETASLARGLCRTLRLNDDLAEAIALAHSVGAPSLGHPGEDALARQMREHGEFRPSTQSARVLSELEVRYPEFNGINLSWEVLEGLAPAGQAPTPPTGAAPTDGFAQPGLEAQAATIADEIAFACNDLEDGLEAGLLQDGELHKLTPWVEVEQRVLQIYSRLAPERRRPYVLRCLIDHLLDDAITASAERIREADPHHPDDVRRQDAPLVGFSERTATAVREMRTLLQHRLYYHHDLADQNRRAARVMEQLFQVLLGHDHLLPDFFAVRIKKEGVHRAACDYLASLGDGAMWELHERLVGDEAIATTKLEQPALF
ncbi:MAG: HD domain-containing protein [Verrucomicrobiota bacterium]